MVSSVHEAYETSSVDGISVLIVRSFVANEPSSIPFFVPRTVAGDTELGKDRVVKGLLFVKLVLLPRWSARGASRGFGCAKLP